MRQRNGPERTFKAAAGARFAAAADAAAEATAKVKKLSTQRGVYVICGCLITHTASAAAEALPLPLLVAAVCLSI